MLQTNFPARPRPPKHKPRARNLHWQLICLYVNLALQNIFWILCVNSTLFFILHPLVCAYTHCTWITNIVIFFVFLICRCWTFTIRIDEAVPWEHLHLSHCLLICFDRCRLIHGSAANYTHNYNPKYAHSQMPYSIKNVHKCVMHVKIIEKGNTTFFYHDNYLVSMVTWSSRQKWLY